MLCIVSKVDNTTNTALFKLHPIVNVFSVLLYSLRRLDLIYVETPEFVFKSPNVRNRSAGRPTSTLTRSCATVCLYMFSRFLC